MESREWKESEWREVDLFMVRLRVVVWLGCEVGLVGGIPSEVVGENARGERSGVGKEEESESCRKESRKGTVSMWTSVVRHPDFF